MASPISTVRDECSLISTLIELMKQEQQLLVAADTEGLNAVTPQKSQLVGQMAALAKQRHQALAGVGCSADDAGMQPWLAREGDQSGSALWQELLTAAREAKELNRVNGMLISKQLHHNQTIINAMRTPTGGNESAVYGPSGQTTSTAPSRRFVVG